MKSEKELEKFGDNQTSKNWEFFRSAYGELDTSHNSNPGAAGSIPANFFENYSLVVRYPIASSTTAATPFCLKTLFFIFFILFFLRSRTILTRLQK